jgi:hypothetical protein
MNTKYTHYIHLIHLFLMPSPLPLIRISGKDLFHLPSPQFFSFCYPSFFKSVIDSPRGFCLSISDMYILYFNQINTPLTYSFFITLPPIIPVGDGWSTFLFHCFSGRAICQCFCLEFGLSVQGGW